MFKQIIKFRVLFLLSLILFSCKDNTLQKFDSEIWKNSTQIERGNMVMDLIDNNYLINKNKLEVIELLGSPKDSSTLHFMYLIDFGYMTPFYLDINFKKDSVSEVKLSD